MVSEVCHAQQSGAGVDHAPDGVRPEGKHEVHCGFLENGTETSTASKKKQKTGKQPTTTKAEAKSLMLLSLLEDNKKGGVEHFVPHLDHGGLRRDALREDNDFQNVIDQLDNLVDKFRDAMPRLVTEIEWNRAIAGRSYADQSAH